MIPTSVQEAQDMTYPGDIVDFVVGQTNVDFVTASATLDAYHGDVADAIIALACGASAAAARDSDIIQANVSSCDVSPLDRPLCGRTGATLPRPRRTSIQE
jgi:hypothetical protein